MTLYTSERDNEPGKSNCTGNCAKLWPPLLVTGEAQASGEWSIVLRDDGGKQWTYRGKPLYLYTRDSAPGDDNGDGIGNQWRVAFKPIPTPPGIGMQGTLLGYVLTDLKSLTLYSFDKDKPDGSGCDLACMGTWMPVLAPGVAHAVADWTIAIRKDGTHQWAFKGKPVYRFAGDVRAGTTSGENAAKGWHAVVLDRPPPDPTWVTIRESDTGEVLADKDGGTLYTFDSHALDNPNRIGRAKQALDYPEDWSPVLAPDDAKQIGSWSVINNDGKKQWAYKGLPLYTNKRDRPGDLFGLRGDRRFHAIKRGLGAQPSGA
jgi:predicted lipoprotein with Yx(FWY)xxD motif